MKHSSLTVATFALAILLLPAAAGNVRADEADEASRAAAPETVREAIRKGLTYVEQGGVQWMRQKKCVTCHQVTFMIWSHHEADQIGIDVDPDKLADWTNWSTNWQHWKGPEIKEDEKTIKEKNPDTMAQIILACAAQSPQVEWIGDFAKSILATQQDDGSWNPGGQLPLQKRPKAETRQVSTMWALLALDHAGAAGEDYSQARRLGLKFIRSATSGKSTEWWATRILVEQKLGDAGQVEQLLDELSKRQNKDGGWGWLCDESSDALATGIALYGLSSAGLGHDHPAVMRAKAFLINTQREDGSWAVRGTKERSRNKVQKHTCVLGSAWAVIGLARTIGTHRTSE